MDRPKNNPRLPVTENRDPFSAPSTGTTGFSESIEVVSIPNVGKIIDAPSNSSPGWSSDGQTKP